MVDVAIIISLTFQEIRFLPVVCVGHKLFIQVPPSHPHPFFFRRAKNRLLKIAIESGKMMGKACITWTQQMVGEITMTITLMMEKLMSSRRKETDEKHINAFEC